MYAGTRGTIPTPQPWRAWLFRTPFTGGAWGWVEQRHTQVYLAVLALALSLCRDLQLCLFPEILPTHTVLVSGEPAWTKITQLCLLRRLALSAGEGKVEVFTHTSDRDAGAGNHTPHWRNDRSGKRVFRHWSLHRTPEIQPNSGTEIEESLEKTARLFRYDPRVKPLMILK